MPARSSRGRTPGLNTAQSFVLSLQRRAGNAAVAAVLQRDKGSAVTSTPERLASTRAATASSDAITVAGTDGAAPYQALKALHLQAGRNVVEMTSHEWKVERYGRFLEGDNVLLREQRALLLDAIADKSIVKNMFDANKDPKRLKSLNALQLKVDKRIAAATVAFTHEGAVEKDPQGTADKAIAAADMRLEQGLEAQSRTAAEKPVVGFAYDETKKLVAEAEAADPSKIKGGATAVDLEKLETRRRDNEIAELFDTASSGPKAPEGRFASWRRGRAEKSVADTKRKQAAALDTDIGKRQLAAQFPAIVAKANKEATPLVQQSILSEQVVAVKRKQLKVLKGTIKNTLKRGTTLAKHIVNKVASGIGGALLSTATFGVVELEARKAQGGYKSERRYVMPWTRLKEDLAGLRRIAETRKDGAFSTSYVVLKGFNELIVKQVRNIFGGLATTLGLLGLIPGAQALLGVAAICGVVAIAAASMKLLVDTVLTAWNAVRSYRNKNAYDERMIKGELMTTGLDAVGSATRVGGAFLGPLASNAAFGAAGSHAHANNPLDMANRVGGIHSGGDLSGVHSLEGGVRNPVGHGDQLGPVPVRVENPVDYMTQQGIKTAGVATSTGTSIAGKVIGAVGGTEGLGSGASAKLEHDDRDQWRTVGSSLDSARGKGRTVPAIGGAGSVAAELEKEAAVKNAARAAQGRWARDQALGLVGRVEELQGTVANVATGVGVGVAAASKDGPEASQDVDGAAGVSGQAEGALAAVASLLNDGAAEAAAP